MPADTLTLTAEERRRWADVARRTYELGIGASAKIANAIEQRPVPMSALDAAEQALRTLEEPEPMDASPATHRPLEAP